jgi:hypothetical protein
VKPKKAITHRHRESVLFVGPSWPSVGEDSGRSTTASRQRQQYPTPVTSRFHNLHSAFEEGRGYVGKRAGCPLLDVVFLICDCCSFGYRDRALCA